jgi:Bacterial regulatory proteins, luxR family
MLWPSPAGRSSVPPRCPTRRRGRSCARGFPAVADFAAACHAATGGNPFLLGELVSEAAAERISGSVADAGRVPEFGAEGVGRAVRRRLRALAGDATTVAPAVAVRGPPVSLDDAVGLTALDREAVQGAVEALVAIGVLAADRELDFVHPIVRRAVYSQIPSLERQRLHARAADLMSERGAESERPRGPRASGADRRRCASAAQPADALGTRVADRRRGSRRAPGRAGLTNREIAQRQFVTVKAVQWHLRNIYRKLDVSSREELPALLTLGSQAETLG